MLHLYIMKGTNKMNTLKATTQQLDCYQYHFIYLCTPYSVLHFPLLSWTFVFFYFLIYYIIYIFILKF